MRTHTTVFAGTLAVLSLAVLSSARADEPQSGLFVIGKSARVEPGRQLEAAVVIGDDLVVAGNVRGIAAAVGGDLHVLRGARVDGPTVAIGGELKIEDGAQVKGPRATVAAGDFSQVAGDLSKIDLNQEKPAIWSGSSVRLAQILSLLVIGLLLSALAPRYVQGVRQTLVQQSGTSVLVGFLVTIGLLPLCILLAVSLVGIPLIPVAIVAVLAACTLGLIALAATLGFATRLIKKPDNLLGAVALGLAILAVGAAVPFFGAFVMFVASACGAGAALLSRFGARPPAPPERQPPAVEHPTAATAGS